MKFILFFLLLFPITLLFPNRENGDIAFRSGKWASWLFDSVGHTGIYTILDGEEVVYHFMNGGVHPNGGEYSVGLNVGYFTDEFSAYPGQDYLGTKKDSEADKTIIINLLEEYNNQSNGTTYLFPMGSDNPESNRYYKGVDTERPKDGLINIAFCSLFTESIYEETNVGGNPTIDEDERDGFGIMPQEQFDSPYLTTTEEPVVTPNGAIKFNGGISTIPFSNPFEFSWLYWSVDVVEYTGRDCSGGVYITLYEWDESFNDFMIYSGPHIYTDEMISSTTSHTFENYIRLGEANTYKLEAKIIVSGEIVENIFDAQQQPIDPWVSPKNFSIEWNEDEFDATIGKNPETSIEVNYNISSKPDWINIEESISGGVVPSPIIMDPTNNTTGLPRSGFVSIHIDNGFFANGTRYERIEINQEAAKLFNITPPTLVFHYFRMSRELYEFGGSSTDYMPCSSAKVVDEALEYTKDLENPAWTDLLLGYDIYKVKVALWLELLDTNQEPNIFIKDFPFTLNLYNSSSINPETKSLGINSGIYLSNFVEHTEIASLTLYRHICSENGWGYGDWRLAIKTILKNSNNEYKEIYEVYDIPSENFDLTERYKNPGNISNPYWSNPFPFIPEQSPNFEHDELVIFPSAFMERDRNYFANGTIETYGDTEINEGVNIVFASNTEIVLNDGFFADSENGTNFTGETNSVSSSNINLNIKFSSSKNNWGYLYSYNLNNSKSKDLRIEILDTNNGIIETFFTKNTGIFQNNRAERISENKPHDIKIRITCIDTNYSIISRKINSWTGDLWKDK